MKQRLEYIDALRGLAILLVVFMHVPQYGQAGDVGGYYMMLVKMLTVPLFFFISGLFVPLSVTPLRRCFYCYFMPWDRFIYLHFPKLAVRLFVLEMKIKRHLRR